MGYLLACPLRRLIHDPRKVLGPYVTPGMTVLEIGPGMGYFTVSLAELVGPAGKAVCVDIQPKMLAGLERRVRKAGLADRVVARQCSATSLGVDDWAGKIDFALAFAVVHEVPDPRKLLGEVQQSLKPGGQCLVAEPRGHVSAEEFERTVAAASEAGLAVGGRPAIARSLAILVHK
jgi:ubiquinone/menaquinone biosynthesis C-methylase UbiE